MLIQRLFSVKLNDVTERNERSLPSRSFKIYGKCLTNSFMSTLIFYLTTFLIYSGIYIFSLLLEVLALITVALLRVYSIYLELTGSWDNFLSFLQVSRRPEKWCTIGKNMCSLPNLAQGPNSWHITWRLINSNPTVVL